jgi:nucleoid-associated protein YgaU
MSPTTPKFHHALAIFLGFAVVAFAADSTDLAALRAKAEQGNGIAQYNLGLAYADAQQPYADRIEAFVWLSLAADSGSTGKALTALTEQITPEQLAEGGRRLQQRRVQLAGAKDAPPPATSTPTPPAPADTALATLTAERDSLAEKLARSDRQIAMLGNQSMSTLKAAEEQKQQLADLQAKVEKATAAQTAAEARAQELTTRLAALERQNAELTARATAAAPAPAVASGASAEEAKKQLAEIEARLTTALRSYSMLQQELDQTRETAAKTETKLATAQAEAAALRTQVDALNPNGKEMILLRQASINVATEAVELRDQLRQAQGSVAQLAEENAQLKTRLALLGPPPAPMLASPARYAPTPPPAATVKSAQAQRPPQSSAAKPAAASPAARQHVVVEGDTLSKISRHYYGTSDRWPEILEANRDILRDARILPVSASLRIP